MYSHTDQQQQLALHSCASVYACNDKIPNSYEGVVPAGTAGALQHLMANVFIGKTIIRQRPNYACMNM